MWDVSPPPQGTAAMGTMGKGTFVLRVLIWGQQDQTPLTPQGRQPLAGSPLFSPSAPQMWEGSAPLHLPGGKVTRGVIAKSRGARGIDGAGFPPRSVNTAPRPPPEPP